MCQIPRKTTKYQSAWSYKEFIEASNDGHWEGCEKTLALSNHKGPKIFDTCLKNLESSKNLWPQTKSMPEFHGWRRSKNLRVYTHVSFY